MVLIINSYSAAIFYRDRRAVEIVSLKIACCELSPSPWISVSPGAFNAVSVSSRQQKLIQFQDTERGAAAEGAAETQHTPVLSAPQDTKQTLKRHEETHKGTRPPFFSIIFLFLGSKVKYNWSIISVTSY